MKITSNTQPSITSTQNKTKNSFGVPDFDPSKPLDFLDDKGNAILDKLLDGKSNEDKENIKFALFFESHYMIPSTEGNFTTFHNTKTDNDSIVKRMENFNKSAVDKLGINNIAKEFLSLYTKETAPKQTQSTEQSKSKTLEQFYTKETQQKAESTKVSLEKTIPEHESRYETLMKMNFDNMNEVERTEFSHLSANRPLEFLSDEANKALAKSLEGKSDEEKGQIKAIISLEFTTSIKMDKSGNIVHGARDFSQKNHDEVVSKLNKFIDDFYKGGGVDTIGTMDVLKDFLSLYTEDENTQKVPNVTLKDLLQKQSV